MIDVLTLHTHNRVPSGRGEQVSRPALVHFVFVGERGQHEGAAIFEVTRRSWRHTCRMPRKLKRPRRGPFEFRGS